MQKLCGSGLDPDSVTLWIRIQRLYGSGSVLGIRIPDPDPDPVAKKLRNFRGKMHFLVFKKFSTKKVTV
jgi:hypothetical protein